MPSETGHRRRSSSPRAYLSSNSISRTPAARLVEALSCQLLTHARQQTASYSITPPLYPCGQKRGGVRPHRICLPRERQKGENQGRSVFIEKSWLIESPRSHFRNMRSSRV